MSVMVNTSGVDVGVESDLSWVSELLAECCGNSIEVDGVGRSRPAQLHIRVTRLRQPFELTGLSPVSRSTWAADGRMVMRDVCTSGFDLQLTFHDARPVFEYRWRPPMPSRAAALSLRSRFHLLARAALLQYPAMWWASTQGAVPLHAPVLKSNGVAVLLAGPAGVGKTTLIMREVDRGASATSDNLSVTDGLRCWGVVEPVRAEGMIGRRMPHGRRETQLKQREDCLIPQLIAVLGRSPNGLAMRRGSPRDAERSLVASTYMAGELRRFWGFAATLAGATDLGPAHPAVTDVAGTLSRRLPSIEVALPERHDVRISDVIDAADKPACA